MLRSTLRRRKTSNQDSLLNLAHHWSVNDQITRKVLLIKLQIHMKIYVLQMKMHIQWQMKIYSPRRIKSSTCLSIRWRLKMALQETVVCQTAHNGSTAVAGTLTGLKSSSHKYLQAKLHLGQSMAVARWPVAATFKRNFSNNRLRAKMTPARRST